METRKCGRKIFRNVHSLCYVRTRCTQLVPRLYYRSNLQKRSVAVKTFVRWSESVTSRARLSRFRPRRVYRRARNVPCIFTIISSRVAGRDRPPSFARAQCDTSDNGCAAAETRSSSPEGAECCCYRRSNFTATFAAVERSREPSL